jgi:hypothetical protein
MKMKLNNTKIAAALLAVGGVLFTGVASAQMGNCTSWEKGVRSVEGKCTSGFGGHAFLDVVCERRGKADRTWTSPKITKVNQVVKVKCEVLWRVKSHSMTTYDPMIIIR